MKISTSELVSRTDQFASRVLRLALVLPKGMISDVLGKQLLRSGTSVGANHREAVRSTSRADFIAKMKIVEREADETQYWLELLRQSGLIKESRLEPLRKEAKELTAIFTAIAKTAKSNVVNCKL